MHAIWNGTAPSPINSVTTFAYPTNVLYWAWQGQENAGPFGDSVVALSDAVVIKKLTFYVTNAPGSAKSWTLTVRKNASSDTAATVTISGTATSATWSGSVSFAQLDLLSMSCTPSGSPASSGNVWWTIEYDSVGSDYYLLFGGCTSNQASDLYGSPLSISAWSGTATDNEVVIPTDLTVTKIAANSYTTPGAGASYIFNVRKNNTTDSSYTANMASASTTALSSTGTLAFTAGDTMVIKRVATGSPNWTTCAYSMTVVPTNAGEVMGGFGNTSTAPQSAVAYEGPMGVGSNNTWNATESNVAIRLAACTIKKLYVKLTTATGSGKSRAFTLRSNGYDTSVATTLTNTATGNDATHSVTHSNGNLFSVMMTPTGTPAITSGVKVGFVQLVPQPTDTTVVTFDAIGTPPTISGTSASWSHTTTGSDTFGFVAFSLVETSTPQLSSLTWGGVSMYPLEHVRNTDSGLPAQEIWFLQNPPSGTQTLTANFASGLNSHSKINSITYTGVGGIGDVDRGITTNGVVTGTVVSDSTQKVISFFGSYGNLGAAAPYSAPSASTRFRYDSPGSGESSVLFMEDNGAATVVSSATTAGSGSMANIALVAKNSGWVGLTSEVAGASATGSATNLGVSWTHSILATSTSTVLIATIAMGTSSSSGTWDATVTAGGVSMTKLDVQGSAASSVGEGVGIFYLFNPPTGSNTIAVTAGGTTTKTIISGVSSTYSSVGSIGTSVNATATTGSALSVTVPSASKQMVVAAHTSGATADWADALDASYTGFQMGNRFTISVSGGGDSSFFQVRGGQSSTVMSATAGSSARWRSMAAALVAQVTVTGTIVKFDAVGGGIANAQNNNTTQSWSHTVASGTGVVVIVGFAIESLFVAWASYAPTAVTFGGQTMLPVYAFLGGNNSDSSSHVAFYVLMNPTNRGTQTVSVTIPNVASYSWMNSVSYTGVGGVTNATFSAGSSTAPTTGAVTSAVNHMVVSIMGAFGQNVSTPTQTVRYAQTSGLNGNAGYIQDAAGAATVTTGMTAASSTTWSALAVDLVPTTASFITGEAATFTMAGSYTYAIPSWCNKIDVILLSGGVAGTDGGGANGAGGNSGNYVSVTLQRGVDIPWTTTTITGTVGAGGASNGASGSASTATATGMTTQTAAGGSGYASIFDVVGKSPGNVTLTSQQYVGGGSQSTLNGAGNAPGGGGAGSGFGSQGGAGAKGQVWFFAWLDHTPTDFLRMFQ